MGPADRGAGLGAGAAQRAPAAGLRLREASEQTCKLTVVAAAGCRALPYGAQAGDATGPGRAQAAAQGDAAQEPLGTLWTLPSDSSQPR